MIIDHFHEFVQDIFKNRFYKLFFHWSWQVRNMFYYFILYILSHKLKNVNFSKTKEQKDRILSESTNNNEKEYSDNVKINFYILS